MEGGKARWNIGDIVWYQDDSGSEVKAEVVEVAHDAMFQLTYDGWGSNWNEVVPLKNILLTSGEKPRDSSSISLNSKVKVLWMSVWYSATVIAALGKGVKVETENLQQVWLKAKEIIRGQKGEDDVRDDIQVDDRVLYEIGGARKEGVVTSVCHNFKVTYNGWSKTYDEEKHIGDIRLSNKKRPRSRAQLSVGQKVQCNWYSTWYDATIIGIRSTVEVMPSDDPSQGPIEIDFAKVEKCVGESREEKPPEVKSEQCGKDPEKELPVKSADAAGPGVKVGDTVLFKQGQRWRKGTVKELIDLYQVNFDGWDEAHDEEKMLNEIRLRNKTKPKGKSELPVGQKIQCEWYSSWYDATITGIKTTVKILPSGGPAPGLVERHLTEVKKSEGESLEDEKKAHAPSSEWPKKKQMPKKAEPKPERKSEPKPERKSEEEESGGVDPGVGRKFKVGDTVEVTGTKSIPWLPATVVEVGPKRIFKVTYPGFTNAYDEYVSEAQCRLENGEQVMEATPITQGCQLNCLWGDGTRYPCKVLNAAVGVLRVLKRGYPPGYETWATASDIKELSATKQDTSFEGMIGKSIADAMSKVVDDASQVKRSAECPAKKVPQETKAQTKSSAKWNQLLSSPLLPDGVANKMKELIAKERRPPWSGKSLLGKEYQAAICASREDQSFADCLAKLLQRRGIKVTVDAEELHDARVFVVIYSDSSSRDENLVRHLTRAAERFNMCETIIVPVIRHHCTAQVVDHIPDNLAYSLSNTVMFNLDLFAEGLPMALKCAVDDVEGVIRNYAEEKTNYDVSGLWLCQAIVDSDLSGFSEIKEFTILINQMGDQIYGKTVDGFQIRGELQGRLFKCRLSYRGEWSQDNVPWKEDDYCFIAEVVAVLHNQGYRLEGECCFVSDVAEKGSEKYLKESGIFNATLEKAGLSGFYNSHWYTEESYEESIAIVHRGGNELIIDFDCSFGTLNNGFFDGTVGTVLMNFADNRHFCQSRLGKLTKDTDGSTAIQFFHYSMENGMTSAPHACAFTRDPVHFLKPKRTEEDALLMELYDLKPERSLHIPFQPGTYRPLRKNEFAVVICCSRQEMSRARQLKSVLEKVQEITPVSVNYSDVAKGARCIILLLSASIQKEPKLIKVIGEAADKEIPIFNIGLDNWFNIFGESNWKDQNMRQDLMNALARLNQTPEDTLDPNHANFRGLVKGIRQHVDPPIFYLSGLWGVEITSEDPNEVIPRYSDLDDSSLQVVHKPSMVFLYFNHLTNKLIMGTDYLVQNMEGWVEPESFTVHLKNAVGKYEMRANEEMDKMYGTYWSQRDNREYRILLTRAEGSLSGIYRWGGDMYVTGIVQVGKSVASVMFGGYTLPAVIDKNQIVFNAPVPLTPHVYITYVAKIAPAPDGNYLAGFAFQSKTMQTRTVFDGMQYTMRPQRVKREEGAKLSEQEKFVEELAENFWKYLEEDNFAAFHDILSEDSKAAMNEEAFKKERLKHLRLEGKYIPGSLIYIGKKAQHQMGKPVYCTRYDFKMSFEKMKDTEFASLVEDKTKKLATLTSYEEDAVMMHASQYDVMISYRSWDARFIDLLQAFLESKGFSVWRDRRMEVGVNWSEDITRAVRRSSCVLSAITENYLASVLCTKEVRMADDIGKPVIPLILPETCRKDNPMHKLVSAHYKGKTLPHTIAHELSKISWCDMRPEAHLDIPDPKDVASFEAKYNKVLTSVIRIISEIVLHSKVLDLQGKWTLDVGSGANKHSYSMVIVANDGTSIEGVLSSTRYGDLNIPIEAKRSWCVGSHFYLEATVIRDKKSNTIKIDAKVDSSGEEFFGTLRFHDSLWDYPDGQPFNALLAMTYKQVDNDATVYSVKGRRTSVFTKDPAAGAEFVVDLERAMAILREAFPDTDKEQLETSIVVLFKSFKKFDTNDSNALDLAELDLALRVAKCTLSEDDKKSVLSELDMDNSGTLDFYEFMTFFAKVRQRKLDQGSVSASVVQQGVIPKVCCVQ